MKLTTFAFDFNAQPMSSKGDDGLPYTWTQERCLVWPSSGRCAYNNFALSCKVIFSNDLICAKNTKFLQGRVTYKIFYTPFFGTRKYFQHRSFSTIFEWGSGIRACWITQIWRFISCHGNFICLISVIVCLPHASCIFKDRHKVAKFKGRVL